MGVSFSPSGAGDRLVPLAHGPAAHHAVEDEGVTLGEGFSGLAGREDCHRSLLLRVGEGADHQQRALTLELFPEPTSESACFVTVSKGSRLHAGSIATQKEVKEMNQI